MEIHLRGVLDELLSCAWRIRILVINHEDTSKNILQKSFWCAI
jgi:hypothetical protein